MLLLAFDYLRRILACGFEDLMANREADDNNHSNKNDRINPPAYGNLSLILLNPPVHEYVTHREGQDG